MDTIWKWINDHPSLSAWFALAAGMVILLVFEARDVGLETSQWFWLVVITVLVAGACIWIISWGDDEEEGDEASGTDVSGTDVSGTDVSDAGSEAKRSAAEPPAAQ